MTTEALRVYKFRGRYYSFSPLYNYMHHPDGSKQCPASELALGDVETWLARRHGCFADLETKLNKNFWTILPQDLARKSLYQKERHPDNLIVSVLPPSKDIAPYVYTFDLERNIFTIQNSHHFWMDNIPPDWTRKLPVEQEASRFRYDERKWPFNWKGDQSEESCISLCRGQPTVEESDISTFTSSDKTVVSPKSIADFKTGKASAVNFARRLFDTYIHPKLDVLEYMIVQWTSDDLTFREYCFAALCSAAGLASATSFVNMSFLKGSFSLRLGTMSHASEPGVEPELLADMCSEYHLEGRSSWCCPPEEVFWMHNVLILIAARLDYRVVAQASIGRLLNKAAEMGVNSFHGIIISFEHVILVRSFPGNRIEHTRPLALICFRNKSSHESVGNSSKGDNGTASYLSVAEGSDGFVAMAHVFEAATLERLPRSRLGCLLPVEICYQIIDKLDHKTRTACSNVSRAFRSHCQTACMIDDERNVLYDDGNDVCHLNSYAANGRVVQIKLEGLGACFPPIPETKPNEWERNRPSGTYWVPALGTTIGRRMLLWDVCFRFRGYQPWRESQDFS